MTLSPWIIYLWGLADQIKGFFLIISLLIFIAVGGYCFYKYMECEEDNIKISKLYKILSVSIISLLLSVLIPTSKTIAIMVIAPAIVNSKPIQQDLPELYSVAIEALKSSLIKTNKFR